MKEIPTAVREAARANYAAGYQAALRDVGMKMLEDGTAAGVKWIVDNLAAADDRTRWRAT